MKFAVTGISMSRRTRRRIGKSRVEIVDTVTNHVFKHVTALPTAERALRVEEAYEWFWNELNPQSPDIVKVIDVREVK
jgi:hypothetical protein